jgi:hypothetical protein
MQKLLQRPTCSSSSSIPPLLSSSTSTNTVTVSALFLPLPTKPSSSIHFLHTMNAPSNPTIGVSFPLINKSLPSSSSSRTYSSYVRSKCFFPPLTLTRHTTTTNTRRTLPWLPLRHSSFHNHSQNDDDDSSVLQHTNPSPTSSSSTTFRLNRRQKSSSSSPESSNPPDLLAIPGVGPRNFRKLVQKGIQGVAQLKQLYKDKVATPSLSLSLYFTVLFFFRVFLNLASFGVCNSL